MTDFEKRQAANGKVIKAEKAKPIEVKKDAVKRQDTKRQ